MTTMTLAGTDVEVNDEGFFAHPDVWTEEMANDLARAEGIELTDRHWQVVRFMRNEFLAKGTGPTVRALGKSSGVSVNAAITSCADLPLVAL